MTQQDQPKPESRSKNKRERRPPRPATAGRLRQWALRYLERYSASSAHLRRLLLVKVERSVQMHGAADSADRRAVERLISDLTDLGLLNDATYAASQTRKLQRQGHSSRAMRARLAKRGLSPEIVDRAMGQLHEEAAEPELAAALTYARRRRLGPYRLSDRRAEHRDRDLAALGRRGFPFELARRVIDAEDLAALEQEAHTAEG